MICDEAHTALGEKTSAAIRRFSEPLYIGMTATEQLIAKQVSDVFPASVDDLPLADAARRGLIAPLRCLRVPPVAAINSVPIVGGDFEERALAAALDHVGAQPGGREPLPRPLRPHARDRLRGRRRARLQPRAGVPRGRAQGDGRLGQDAAARARRDARRLRARRDQRARSTRSCSPRAGTRRARPSACTSRRPPRKRVYQQRIGRIMRTHPRKEAGIVVDFVPKGATHAERVVSLHSLLDSDFYREGARVTPAPRRRSQRRARRRLSPAPWLVPVTPDVAPPARRDPARVAARRPASSSTTTSSASGRRSPDARSASTSAPSSRASSPRAAPARVRSRRSSRSAPPRTRTAGCA